MASWSLQVGNLTDETLLVPIEVNELGGRPNVDSSLVGGQDPPEIWTGTISDGTGFDDINHDYCSDWTDDVTVALNGVKGGIFGELGGWTTLGPTACNGFLRHVYCFEQ